MKQSGGWISSRVAVGLVLVSALSMIGFLALSAYAPELRTESNGRADVFSRSAIGFAGLRLLLEDSGTPVAVSRNPEPENAGLLVLTPRSTSTASEVARLANGQKASQTAALIVLPKWLPIGNPFHAGWVVKDETLSPSGIAGLVKELAAKTVITRRKGSAPVALKATNVPFARSPWNGKIAIDSLQTIKGDGWEPLITDQDGNAVVARLHGSQIYVLSDPDLINTHALSNFAVAAGAVALIRHLPGGANSVTFDVTLSGFRKSRSLLRSAFGPPFLGATLCALLAAGLLGFHAMSRFGTPRAEERTFAFGKRSLADNTAALIRMMDRQPRMARRYGLVSRRLAAKILRHGRSEEWRWLEAIEHNSDIKPGFAELMAEAESAETDSALMKAAEKLHEWRLRITHERS